MDLPPPVHRPHQAAVGLQVEVLLPSHPHLSFNRPLASRHISEHRVHVIVAGSKAALDGAPGEGEFQEASGPDGIGDGGDSWQVLIGDLDGPGC